MGERCRDFMISGLAVLPTLLWALTGSVELFAVAAVFMLLATITVAMAMPHSADRPKSRRPRQPHDH